MLQEAMAESRSEVNVHEIDEMPAEWADKLEAAGYDCFFVDLEHGGDTGCAGGFDLILGADIQPKRISTIASQSSPR